MMKLLLLQLDGAHITTSADSNRQSCLFVGRLSWSFCQKVLWRSTCLQPLNQMHIFSWWFGISREKLCNLGKDAVLHLTLCKSNPYSLCFGKEKLLVIGGDQNCPRHVTTCPISFPIQKIIKMAVSTLKYSRLTLIPCWESHYLRAHFYFT